ncbi:dihydroorotate dehydrogenase (quinone) [Boudabousia liubingyangii]|uniref:Dihydroorotate dehydrogenase (quinone) n=1 Tax=Boudabousia liubingyangii TaxID=1921764 RepID=A0A1Q5PJB0_9ACTO|nr:quinone-dependent dihydroorotate dehydrogenase [Boudabousia liubingyangii]OKL45964.1 dihydroorotate dehydrogenase (quinone) [Boudabousia liubingyangii]OKL47760.1 dihydroorotate dehydrogenase (quinone) [Boudabousia liubingyangii]
MDNVYSQIFDKILVRTDAEKIHHRTIWALNIVGRIQPLERIIAARFSNRALRTVPQVGKDVFDRPVPGYVGLAAGLDKNAEAVVALDALGFAFVEIGTVTDQPQPGNEGKRLWRHPSIDAIRNRMGFNNDGADVIAKRLQKLRSTKRGRQVIVGVNLGKNKTVPAEGAVENYVASTKKLARWADYLVINVSSPNTPGLRDLQAKEALKPILEAVISTAEEAAGRLVPVFVKIAPDLEDEQIMEVCDLVNSSKARGIIATNTTINHELGEGGLSGRPLTQRAAAVVRIVKRTLNADKKIIGVGGIWNEVDARRMLEAGADLLQVYTSFIFQGPAWLKKLNRSLVHGE